MADIEKIDDVDKNTRKIDAEPNSVVIQLPNSPTHLVSSTYPHIHCVYEAFQ